MNRNEALKAAWNDNVVRVDDAPLTLLVAAYRAARQLFAQTGRAADACKFPMPARLAILAARDDAAAGKRRYPALEVSPAVCWQAVSAAPRGTMGHVETPANAGLREVGRVMPECSGRNGYWDTRGDCGWHTEPGGDVSRDGSGLCYGVVFQLPARKGKARFVAGYQFGGCDGGPTIDFGTIYEGEYSDNCSYDGALGNPAAREAAFAADSMAQRAAEEELEYQAAWQAGRRYADLAEEVKGSRETVRALLRQRREAMKAIARAIFPDGRPAFDRLCEAVRHDVAGFLVDIAKARVTMRRLAEGEHVADYLPGFYAGDSRLQAAFCEGAGLNTFPA